jgi:uncharacterized membrane protein YtjA (UPF0391 family)
MAKKRLIHRCSSRPAGAERLVPAGVFVANDPVSAGVSEQRGFHMLGWAVTFLIIALIAAVLGFGAIAGTAIEIAKIIFFVAILLFLISAVFGLVRGGTPAP